MVAKPLIDYLLEHNYKLTIACNTCDNARKILKDHPNGEVIYWDANETEVLKQIFLARHKDGSTEVISSQMVDYGSSSPGGDTSVARTVALPAAIAARLITEGKIDLKGVYRPVKKEIYMPVLESLEELGIKTEEEYGLPESELMF